MTPRQADAHPGDLWNEDLAPTQAHQRTWRWMHFAALWVGMVMCIPAYTLAASLIEAGMSWSQAVGTVFLGNLIVLLPMLLIGHAGAKHGIPYAVLARASFGTRGAKLPALLRALVACGWYGIQTWFGGMMIYTLAGVLIGHPLEGDKLPGLGINLGQLVCFLLFWAIQFYFVVHGIESIRKLETWTAPIKIVICGVLLVWAYQKAGGFGPIREAWLERAAFLGETITIRPPSGAVTGVFVGLDPGGRLLLETSTGPQTFDAGDLFFGAAVVEDAPR